MKKIILIFVIACMPALAFAQNSIFDKFEDMDDVTTVIVTPEAFKMISKFKGSGPEAQDYVDMVSGLTSFRVFTTEDLNIAGEMQAVVSKYLKSANLTEMMRVKDKDAHVKIYVREGKDEDHVSELLMFVSDIQRADNKDVANQEAVILSLTGDINLNKIAKLTDAHIPNSSEHLNKKN